MRFLVTARNGPGFASPQEAIGILEDVVLPSLNALVDMERSETILAGGLPVGARAFVFIAEAASPDELDRLLREIPMWGTLHWEVTPLQSFKRRAAQERTLVDELKGGTR
jgi:hypothetical protein